MTVAQNLPAKYFMTAEIENVLSLLVVTDQYSVYINFLMYCLIDIVKTGFHRDFCVGKRKL